LLRRGISCRVTGRAQTYPTSTQGHALQPRTLELSRLMGIAPQIFATGITSLVTNFYADGKLILEPDMGIGRDGGEGGESPRPQAPGKPGDHGTGSAALKRLLNDGNPGPGVPGPVQRTSVL
jgi:hypothetical protein